MSFSASASPINLSRVLSTTSPRSGPLGDQNLLHQFAGLLEKVTTSASFNMQDSQFVESLSTAFLHLAATTNRYPTLEEATSFMRSQCDILHSIQNSVGRIGDADVTYRVKTAIDNGIRAAGPQVKARFSEVLNALADEDPKNAALFGRLFFKSVFDPEARVRSRNNQDFKVTEVDKMSIGTPTGVSYLVANNLLEGNYTTMARQTLDAEQARANLARGNAFDGGTANISGVNGQSYINFRRPV